MLDTVVQELAMDPAKRWIQVLCLFIISILYSFLLYTTIFFKKVETAFFLRWWREQNDETQQLVWQLVQQGQVHPPNSSLYSKASPPFSHFAPDP